MAKDTSLSRHSNRAARTNDTLEEDNLKPKGSNNESGHRDISQSRTRSHDHHKQSKHGPKSKRKEAGEERVILTDWLKNLPRRFFDMENRMRLAAMFLQAEDKDEALKRLAKAGEKPRRKKKKRRLSHPMHRFSNLQW